MNDGARPLRINGITEDDFNQWRTHPVTLAVLRFFSDFSKEICYAHGQKWLAGPIDPDESAMDRGKALTHHELSQVNWGNLVNFYAGEQEEDDDEGQQAAQ